MESPVSVSDTSAFLLILQPVSGPMRRDLRRVTPLKTKYENREAIPATWGLVNSWAKDASRASMCINAKAETMDKLLSFREAFEKRRCVVPADGFYEWRGPKARREPLWIHPADNALLLFAGLFEAWQSQPGEWQTTFTILTTSAIDWLSQFPTACRLFSTRPARPTG